MMKKFKQVEIKPKTVLPILKLFPGLPIFEFFGFFALESAFFGRLAKNLGNAAPTITKTYIW
jgi:hypothetical protein